MYIKKVYLENFRNFKTLDLNLDQGFVVIAAKNGAGKTNFLESIYQGATLRRFPESDFRQLFLDGESHFRIRLTYQNDEEAMVEQFSELTEKSYRHKLTHNGQQVTRTVFPKALQVISFLPQDLNLLTRSPGGRRGYLDEVLSAVSQEYRHSLSQYQKTLKQRNDLLRKIVAGEAGAEDLGVWSEKLVEFGGVVIKTRQEFLGFVNSNMPTVMEKLDPNLNSTTLLYKNSGEPDRESFLQKLSSLRDRELALGTTVLGPHRDDFEAQVLQKRAAGYVSRGELRSITLALKILEKKYIEIALGQPPVLLLDDVFSEFDEEHQQSLIEFLQSVEQVFITTAHLEEVKKRLPENTKVYNVVNETINAVTE